jgi:anti-sigma factor RsiW
MSHLDEGTLHALLDGELDLAEVSEIQIHLGTCVACGSRLQEVKQVLAEADRLVGAMEVPAGATRPMPEPPRTSAPRSIPEPAIWNDTPVLLLPEAGEASVRRTRWMKRLRWAAVIVVVVGAGKVITGAVRPNEPRAAERDLTSATPSVPPAVIGPEERRRSDSGVTVARAKPGRAPTQPRPFASKLAARPERAVAPEALANTDGSQKDTAAAAIEDTAAADTQLLAARDARDSANETAPAAAAVTDSVASGGAGQDSPAQTRSTEEDDLATRRAAAAALAELDRERRRERANAATASLPRAAVAQPEEPAPRPPTLEQRSQIYLRIGLDEAAKQLGRPVHVIEGMTPQFMGLARGQLMPGGNSRRPVVRVVYLDPRGRMILLDQQRMDSGEAPAAAAGNLRWAIGDVLLYLRGEPGPEVLQSLRERVR